MRGGVSRCDPIVVGLVWVTLLSALFGRRFRQSAGIFSSGGGLRGSGGRCRHFEGRDETGGTVRRRFGRKKSAPNELDALSISPRSRGAQAAICWLLSLGRRLASDACGSWTSEVDVTLCAPEKVDGAAWDWARGKWVLREYRPACRKCSGNTHAASDDEQRHLPCPVCGAPNESQDSFLWD